MMSQMTDKEKKRRLDIVYNNIVDMMLKQGNTHVTLLNPGAEDQKIANLSAFIKKHDSRTRKYFKKVEDIKHAFSSRLSYCSIFTSLEETKNVDEGDDNEDTIVLFIEERESNSRESKDPMQMAIENGWKNIYIISPVELTPTKKQAVENSRREGLSVIAYVDYQLAISVLKHAFSPSDIQTYTPNNIREFRQKEMIDPSKISLMKQSDPIARALNLERGSVIIEKIPGTTTETDIVYRKVVL